MYLKIRLALAALALSTVAVGQVSYNNAPSDGPFQVRYFANLGPLHDSLIDFANTGANGTADICVNTYTFAADEQLVSCCSCRVTRNALWSLSVRNDLLSNTLTLGSVTSGLVKLLATAPTAAGQAGCDPASATGLPVQGMAAWGTSIHIALRANGNPDPFFPGFGTETPFTNSSLSAQEQAIMTSYCGFIKLTGSGFGICRSCDLAASAVGINPATQTTVNNSPEQNTGLGAAKQ